MALAVSLGPDFASTSALFVAIARNPGNAFGVPSVLAPPSLGATPQADGKVRVEWVEPGAATPAATSWAGTYLVYRGNVGATPAPGAVPYATVISDATGKGYFIDGLASVPANGTCQGSTPCTVENVRYYYWVRALSRQTGFPSPAISAMASAAPDRTPPQIIAVSPATGTFGVPLSTNVQVTFSEPVDFGATAGAVCIAPRGTSNCVAVTANQARWARTSGVLLEFTPSDRLAAHADYDVSFVATGSFGVKDLAGNALAPGIVATFTTEVPATTVPIRWRSPAVNGQEYMGASGKVIGIAFSESMDQASINGAFQVFSGEGCNPSNPVPMSGQWNATGNAVSFSPASPLSVGLMASPTFGVYAYSMRLNDGTTAGRSRSGNPAQAIPCANGTFIPSASTLRFDLGDVPSGTSLDAPAVVAGETVTLRSESGPWRQGAYVTLTSMFDEPRTTGVATGSLTITGDTWAGLDLAIPSDAPNGTHLVGVQNDAIGDNVGQDARTAFRTVNVVSPTITVTTHDLSDTTEATSRTELYPIPTGDSVRIRVQVTAPGRDGTGVRPVPGIAVRIKALGNPTSYGPIMCAQVNGSACTGSATELEMQTDAQGIARGFLTAPATGAPFNSIVLLAAAGSEWGSVVLIDPVPVPPTGLTFIQSTGSLAWGASASRGVVGYRVRIEPASPVGTRTLAGSPVVVIDAGPNTSVALPPGAVVAGGSYRASVVAYDAAGRESARTDAITFVAPSPTATATPTPTGTPTPTATTSGTRTATTTATASATATGVSSATATATATGVSSATFTIAATPTASAGPSATAVATATSGLPVSPVPSPSAASSANTSTATPVATVATVIVGTPTATIASGGAATPTTMPVASVPGAPSPAPAPPIATVPGSAGGGLGAGAVLPTPSPAASPLPVPAATAPATSTPSGTSAAPTGAGAGSDLGAWTPAGAGEGGVPW